MYTYSFEKLQVWVEAKDFAKTIYKVTSLFSDTEKFGLTSQLRRASVSIASNIAEGSARNTYKDKAHFTTMAFSSSVEVLNQLIIAFEIGLISGKEYDDSRSLLKALQTN